MRNRSSFTLIELLIVIGILAVLVAAIVITLNPAQLLQEARDSKRQQDLSALNQALNTITTLDQSLFMGTSSLVYTSLPDATTTCANWNLPSLPAGWQYYCVATSSLQNTNGTGWIPVNFKTTGVVSLSSLPTDPINASSSNLYYTYVSGGSFELTAAFESSKFKLGGDKDTVSTDGGSYPDLYEVGSNLSLAPLDYGDTSLVGYWKFDETTGTTAYDSSGRGNNGILTNNPIWTAGKKRGALRFSLASQYVSKSIVSSSPVALSISFWFNPDSINSSYRDMVGVADNDTGRFHLNNGDNAINWYPFINSGIIPVVGSWYYAVGVYDGLSKKIYVNGILRGTATNSTSFVFDRMKVGSDGEIFNGVLDEVSYYNRALSASEVTALYNATR